MAEAKPTLVVDLEAAEKELSGLLDRMQNPKRRAEVAALADRLANHRMAITDTAGSDPRVAGGGITDVAADPFAHGSVIVDTRNAVLMDAVEVSTIDTQVAGRSAGSALALVLSGRINKSQDRARILFLFGADGAAAIVTELLALGQRMSDDGAFLERLVSRFEGAPWSPPRGEAA